MQLNSINNQPSFGMAKLTSKGRVAAETFAESLTNYTYTRAYDRSNLLPSLLKKVSKNTAGAGSIDAFFSQGQTEYATLNRQFVNKQVLTLRGKHAIKKFLNKDHKQAAEALTKSKQTVLDSSLTTKGDELIASIIKLFDKNINNQEISAKKGKALLDLVKKYIGVEDLVKRAGVVSEEILSK